MEAYQKLKKIFNGLERAHGVFYKGEKKDNGKLAAKLTADRGDNPLKQRC